MNESFYDPENEPKIEELLSQMTLAEKISMLSGKDSWNTMPIERLGIPALTVTDGPNGVRAPSDRAGRTAGPTTAFPTGSAMGATWDPDLIHEAAAAMAEETLGMDCDILLGPCVNIVRTPLAGRNFETYAEDPYLAGRIGAAWVKGLQSKRVGASLKHFALNNQEINRMRGSSEVDERTMREIYLPAFETIVKEAQPWTVMTSYNKVNGAYASENPELLKGILEEEWGFEGAVISDWTANHSTIDSKNAGLDIEMPGPAKYYGPLLREAVKNWQVPEAEIDESVRRILRILFRSGRMDGAGRPGGSVNTPEHQETARRVAEAAITLLKNDGGLLPLNKENIRSLAVIGPNAEVNLSGGWGSSQVEPPYNVGALEAIRAALGDNVQVSFAMGADNRIYPPVMKADFFRQPGSDAPGLRAYFYNNADFSGEPALERVETNYDNWWWGSPSNEISPETFSVKWAGSLRVPKSGTYNLMLGNTETCRIYIDGRLVLENAKGAVSAEALENDPFSIAAGAPVDLEAGRSYEFGMEFIKTSEEHFSLMRLMCIEPQPEGDPIEQAVALARSADAVVIVGGLPDGFETEGNDRPNMDLPGPQTELIRAVVQANPKTAVVLYAGAPVSMPWIHQVPAVLLAYYPGQEGGRAISNVLFGEVNPSGKLPVTFPARLEDNPSYLNYPGDREVHYGERIFVGYRYYDARKVEPLFPFGHGLSYTTFEYGQLEIPAEVAWGDRVTVSVTVTNTGQRAGKEVVQIYVSDPESSLARPPKELKRFEKVSLRPGERKTVTFELDDRALAFYDPYKGYWVLEPGRFEVLAGSSSRDIRQRGVFVVKE
jgi:beta-glucosidase